MPEEVVASPFAGRPSFSPYTGKSSLRVWGNDPLGISGNVVICAYPGKWSLRIRESLPIKVRMGVLSRMRNEN